MVAGPRRDRVRGRAPGIARGGVELDARNRDARPDASER